MDFFNQIKSFNPRQGAQSVLNLAYVISSALIIWKVFILLTFCESPIVVVLSGSMEPAFYRGDLLFLSNYKTVPNPYLNGDILVFKIRGKEIPIVHRIFRMHETYVKFWKLYFARQENRDVKILTKGDANQIDDRGLYAKNQKWLDESDLIGRAQGYVKNVTFFIAIDCYRILVWLPLPWMITPC